MAITNFNGFYAAWANTDGTRNTNSEFQLIPGPVRVEYPQQAAGTIIETSDGAAVQQQPNNDSRIRSWIWEGYVLDLAFDQWYVKLEGLRSRYRRENGQSPYVYLLEDATALFWTKQWITSTCTTGGTTTITDTTQAWLPTGPGLGQLQNQGVMFPATGQQGYIISNTATTFTLAQALPTAVANGDQYVAQAWFSTWFRCRVTEVSRTVSARGGAVRVDQTKLQFVIDDPTWNFLG